MEENLATDYLQLTARFKYPQAGTITTDNHLIALDRPIIILAIAEGRLAKMVLLESNNGHLEQLKLEMASYLCILNLKETCIPQVNRLLIK